MRLLMEIAKGIGLICVLFSSVAARRLTLSVAPNSVEVSSSGNIDVTIGTPGAGPVKLQLVVDLNANGSADGTEPTVHQIELADGVRAAVGGVRNPNVTSDEDGAVNGTIQARVRLAQFPELGRLAGKYIWRATGSDGSSQDQPFTVTQPETGQQISGTVTSNGSAVAYAGVVVLDATADDGEPVGGAYADANGNYTVKVATGSYLVLPTRIGLVTRFEDAPMVEVSASEQATADLTLVASTRLINGFVRKAGSGTAVAGIQVFGESEDGEALALGVTGSNGQFSLPALAGTWLVGISERQVSAYGLIRPADDETVSTSAGNAENVVMELNEPTR